MTTRTKEEQQLLDEKIARIQKKNEEILRRQKEIEEDKRLAEQQNALVKLRPSTVNASRERTPALKPSKRELREDFPDNFEEPVIQRNTRGSFRGRGGERFRGQGDWKTSGPPPDPKSFLYDDERDGPPRDRDGKGDLRRELDRKRSDERVNREDSRGIREFQRGGQRDGGDYRVERGRRGGSRARGGRNDEEAWRAERLRIDEARIQRQKSADGKWRREWDNEKIVQDSNEEPRYESRRLSNQEQWHSPHQHHPHHHPHHQPHPHQCQMHSPHSGHHHHSSHDCPHHPQPIHRGRGKGRGRLDVAELEMPLDNIPIDIIPQKLSPRTTSLDSCSSNEATHEQRQHKVMRAQNPSHSTHSDDFKFSGRRSIECVGDRVKISILNTNVAHSPPKTQRKMNEPRGRFRSQASYSSQSDEDSPRERGQRGGRQRVQKNPKSQEKLPFQKNKNLNNTEITAVDPLTSQNKPPLPPHKLNQKTPSPAEDIEGDESWEDVTTSGAESTGEELISGIPNITIMNSAIRDEANISDPHVLEIEPSDYTFHEYLNKVGVSTLSENLSGSEVVMTSPLDNQTLVGIEPLTLHIEDTIDGKTEGGNILETNVTDVDAIVNLKEVEKILEDINITLANVSEGKGSSSDKIEENFQSDSQPENAKSEIDIETKNTIPDIKVHVAEEEKDPHDTKDTSCIKEPEKQEFSSDDL